MLNGGIVLGILALLYFLMKDFRETRISARVRFDWDAYNRDVRNGLDSVTQKAKLQSGAYYTTEPCTLLDIERFRYDLKVYGREITEQRRRDGEYSFLYKSIDQKIYEREQKQKIKHPCS